MPITDSWHVIFQTYLACGSFGLLNCTLHCTLHILRSRLSLQRPDRQELENNRKRGWSGICSMQLDWIHTHISRPIHICVQLERDGGRHGGAGLFESMHAVCSCNAFIAWCMCGFVQVYGRLIMSVVSSWHAFWLTRVLNFNYFVLYLEIINIETIHYFISLPAKHLRFPRPKTRGGESSHAGTIVQYWSLQHLSNVILEIKILFIYLFIFGHFTKMCCAKFPRFIVKASPKTAWHKRHGCNLQIET